MFAETKSEDKHQKSALGMFITGLLIYWIFNNWWNPADFNPFSYWNLDKGAPTELLLVICVIAPFLLGQLYWLHPRDNTSSVSIESLPWKLKMLISVYAGIFEELTFRGTAIYSAMIVIALANKFFAITLALLFIILVLVIISLSKNGGLQALVILGAVVLYVVVLSAVPEDPWYAFYEYWYVPLYSSLFGLENRELAIKVVLGFALLDIGLVLAIKLGAMWIANRSKSIRNWQVAKMASRYFDGKFFKSYIAITIGLSVYIYWMISYTDAVNVFAEPAMLTWAIISCAISFQEAHGEQNFTNMLHKIVFSFFMMGVAFNYGLVYAIVGHMLYDAVYFTSEHLVYMLNSRS